MSDWSFSASYPVIAAGVVLWLATFRLSYLNWIRNDRRPGVRRLETFRVLLVFLLFLTLIQPEYTRQIERQSEPAVALLHDRSGSMETQDVLVETNATSRGEWVDRVAGDRYWRDLEPSTRVLVQDFGSAARQGETHAPPGTNLSAPLENLLESEDNLKAVLLLTDGDWNLGDSPIGVATRYRDRNIPIYAITVGRSSPLPDLSIENAAPPSYALQGEQISVPFEIHNSLNRGVETEARLMEAGAVIARKKIFIPNQKTFQDSIVWSPQSAGMKEMQLRIDVERDETLPDNNEAAFNIEVRKDTLNVLVVDSLPRWEYRYLRNALERDPGVNLHCLLFHPRIGTGEGRFYLSAFPGSKELLGRYDVVFLGDVGIGPGELTTHDAELLKGLVEQQASGLVLIPGRRGRLATLLGSPLEELLPVQIDEESPLGAPLQNEARLLLTRKGRTHWLTRFESDETRNEELWKMLPGFFWSAAVVKSRPGSEVLAVHSLLRNSWGRLPILVTRPFGNGKVLFMGTDSAWRWRRGVEDKYHYRLWSQVTRWMSHQRHLSEDEGIRLTFTPESPVAGDKVYLQATVLDQSGYPIQEGTVSGKIIDPSGKAETVVFSKVEGGWGVYQAELLAEMGGKYQIELKSEKENRRLSSELEVSWPSLEKVGRPVNERVLAELAQLTGGNTGSPGDLESMMERISLLPEPRPFEKRIRVWSNPWWGGLLLTLISLYWIGRKAAGMV